MGKEIVDLSGAYVQPLPVRVVQRAANYARIQGLRQGRRTL